MRARPTRWTCPSPGEETREFWAGEHVAVAVRRRSTVLGSAKMGPNRPAQGDATSGTASFMVGVARPAVTGVGRALGEYVVDWLPARTASAPSSSTPSSSTNTAAVRLWESLGFEIIGTVPEAFRLPGDVARHADLHVDATSRRSKDSPA